MSSSAGAQNIWSMYSGREGGDTSALDNGISDTVHQDGRRVMHWNPRILGLVGGGICLTMVLVLSLGISLGTRAAKVSNGELDVVDWHDACKYSSLSDQGFGKCQKQCDRYVCCDDFGGSCTAEREAMCDKYENWCANIRVTANSRGIPPSAAATTMSPTEDWDKATMFPTEGFNPTRTPAPSFRSIIVTPNFPIATLTPTKSPTTSEPSSKPSFAPTFVPSQAPVVSPKITPSPSQKPVTEAPVKNFKM